jgi:hypothetical protein
MRARRVYDRAKKELRVEASSARSTATLKVHVSATDELIGTLTNNGGGKYSGQFTWRSSPQHHRQEQPGRLGDQDRYRQVSRRLRWTGAATADQAGRD